MGGAILFLLVRYPYIYPKEANRAMHRLLFVVGWSIRQRLKNITHRSHSAPGRGQTCLIFEGQAKGTRATVASRSDASRTQRSTMRKSISTLKLNIQPKAEQP
jgi:hypothetical protein